MSDYTNYIELELPEWMEKLGADPILGQFSDYDQGAVQQALTEIYSTPEGQVLIEAAAKDAPGGTVNIFNNLDGNSYAFQSDDNVSHNDIGLGTKDADLKYHSPETEHSHDFSIQRSVFHELSHLTQDKFDTPEEMEADAIKSTNDFMQKYYGESPRGGHTEITHEGGTKEWDINSNFKDEAVGFQTFKDKSEITELFTDEVAAIGPNAQSFKVKPMVDIETIKPDTSFVV